MIFECILFVCWTYGCIELNFYLRLNIILRLLMRKKDVTLTVNFCSKKKAKMCLLNSRKNFTILYVFYVWWRIFPCSEKIEISEGTNALLGKCNVGETNSGNYTGTKKRCAEVCSTDQNFICSPHLTQRIKRENVPLNWNDYGFGVEEIKMLTHKKELTSSSSSSYPSFMVGVLSGVIQKKYYHINEIGIWRGGNFIVLFHSRHFRSAIICPYLPVRHPPDDQLVGVPSF